ncbi:MAG TPA: hypothetical protein VJ741_11195 [Solirubrobacteraceae bacterium]|nr:hypothetical protein [Solirubrobacteraceae bacterium]
MALLRRFALWRAELLRRFDELALRPLDALRPLELRPLVLRPLDELARVLRLPDAPALRLLALRLLALRLLPLLALRPLPLLRVLPLLLDPLAF